MKKGKRLTAMGLTAVMMLSLAACGKTEGDSEVSKTSEGSSDSEVSVESQAPEDSVEQVNELDWLNPSTTLPLVKEGTDKKLSMFIRMSSDSPDPEETWLYKFIEEVMNIDLEVTKFTSDNMQEFLSLAFAGGDLPDIIIGGGFSTEQLVNYGAMEGQIIDLSPYMNETYMPNLTAIYNEHPDYKSTIMDSEGRIWSTGFIDTVNNAEMIPRTFLNYDLIEECGKEVPETLDEFLDVMRAIKEKDSSLYPVGGAWSDRSPCTYILNAFGYLTSDPYGISPALRDGKVVVPVADREAYGAYLTFMNTLYEEGLLHPDFFTMTKQNAEALMTEGKSAFFTQAPFLYMDDYSPWWGAIPLTSEYNDTAQWPDGAGSALTAGGIVVTSACEEPELAATFIDWFYTSDHYRYSTLGYNVAFCPEEWSLGTEGWFYDVETNANLQYGYLNHTEDWGSQAEYMMNVVQLWSYSTVGSNIETEDSDVQYLPLDIDGYNVDNYADIRKLDLANWEHYTVALATCSLPYATPGYPSNVYLDSETALNAADLKVAISEYAKQETAKFITGARSLDKLDDYFDEIEALGAAEYVQIYQDYYDKLNAN